MLSLTLIFYLHVVNMIQSMSFKCHIRSQVINFCQSKMNKTVPKIQIWPASCSRDIWLVSSDKWAALSSVPTANCTLHLLDTEQSCQSTWHLNQWRNTVSQTNINWTLVTWQSIFTLLSSQFCADLIWWSFRSVQFPGGCWGITVVSTLFMTTG